MDNFKGRASRYLKAKLPCANALTPEVVILGQYRNFKVDKVQQ